MQNQKRFTFLIILPACFILLSWGVTGHRTVGSIAQNHLSTAAKVAMHQLIGDTSLAEISTWADKVRSTPAYEKTAPWHDLYVPLGLSFRQFDKYIKSIKEGNLYSALRLNEQILVDKNTTRTQKVEALKFVVHFVGDLHQPMHVARFEDDGGSDIKLSVNGDTQSLHHIWDTYLIEHQGFTNAQLTEKCDHATPRQIREWQGDNLMVWLWESYEISTQIYSEIDRMKGQPIDEKYYKKHIDIIHERLEKAGIRLAGVLNKVFADGLTSSVAE